MKRILLVLMACFPVIGLMAAEVEPLAGDTIITLERKRIEVKDNGDRMKVRVYEVDEDGDSVDDELIFEGHYRDGQSYERRKHVKSINIPVPTWDKDFNPHWAGFGMGFANFADGSLHVNDVDGVSLRSGNSLEYNLNVLEKAFPFSRYRWAVVIGAGMRWSRFTPFSVLGGLCWSTLFTLLGYFFGNIPAVQDHFELVIVLILLVSLAPTIIGLFKAKFGKKKPAKVTDAQLDAMEDGIKNLDK